LTVTGQGPYDGVDDTLVGIVNDSAKPVTSVALSSDSDIFGFDGDGIDTYGAPGNSHDTTGYGGPDAYFTNINAFQTTGTVNFVTPLPADGGTTYFGLENAVSDATSCQDAINGSVKDATDGPNIYATFTPNNGLTIQQAAQLCGLQNFDWSQQVTQLPDPSPFFAINAGGALIPNGTSPVRLTSLNVPFYDPPQGGGYTYYRNNNYPFYYNVTTQLPGFQVGGTTMTFQDEPKNPCLPGGAGVHTDLCAGGEAPAGSHESFATQLAGVNSDGSATDLGIGFTWTSNYNGTTGQASLAVGNRTGRAVGTGGAVGTGTGGVTITSVEPDTTYSYDGIAVTGINGAPSGPAASRLVYSGAQALPEGARDTLSAQLTTIDSAPIQGHLVRLTLGAGRKARSCTGVSDKSGTASCEVYVRQPLGPTAVTAAFAGNTSYLASGATGKVIVFAYTRHGTFVVGNESAGDLLPGPSVTFWGPQWAQRNQLSGGSAPTAFDGFEESVAPPECSALHKWSARPSAMRGPWRQRLHVPAYTAVIVSSSITAHRWFISGNMVDVVIVAVTPRHGFSRFSPRTGTIVAALC
jgi:hypothetical protein